jgi:hypothetical protein
MKDFGVLSSEVSASTMAETTDEIFATTLREWGGANAEDELQEILVRMCRSLSDAQGNLLYDFLCLGCVGKHRVKIHQRFIRLLVDELMNQHDYQHRPSLSAE